MEGESKQRGGSIGNIWALKICQLCSLVQPSLLFKAILMQCITSLLSCLDRKCGLSEALLTVTQFLEQAVNSACMRQCGHRILFSGKNSRFCKIRHFTLRHYTTHGNSIVIYFRVNKVHLYICTDVLMIILPKFTMRCKCLKKIQKN